ncbi:hypothetical protein [Mycobacteroides franklinii]|uniref:hypothetical protein n=1 Tax=Mycobacteroides franklinii TaxID=948102 RepID=UPI000991E8CE|nr:hypothetical protein [Mycobacteroides franklinii]
MARRPSGAIGHFADATLFEHGRAPATARRLWGTSDANDDGKPATTRITRFLLLAIISSSILIGSGGGTRPVGVALTSDHQRNRASPGPTTRAVCADATAVLDDSHRTGLLCHICSRTSPGLTPILGFWMIVVDALALSRMAVAALDAS